MGNFCAYTGYEVVELNVQPDHVHLVVMIPPKVSGSELCGRFKRQPAMNLFHQFRLLKKKVLGQLVLGQRILC